MLDLINILLSKDVSKRPSTYDIFKLPIIKHHASLFGLKIPDLKPKEEIPAERVSESFKMIYMKQSLVNSGEKTTEKTSRTLNSLIHMQNEKL